MLDADSPFEKQDLTIADLVEREGRGLVFAVNKWDLVEETQSRLAELRKAAEAMLPQLAGAPLVPVSALSGQGLDKLMKAAFTVYEAWNKRIATAELNRWFGAALERHQPPAVSGRRIKLRYITQANAPAACVRRFLLAARGAARVLPALPRQRPEEDIRSRPHARSPLRAQNEKPLCR